MKIVCDSCGAKYSIADEKVAGKVFKIRCKRCSQVIVVKGNEDAAPAAAPEAPAPGEGVWYIVVDGEQQGPMTPQAIGELLSAGRVDWEAYTWREGFDGWRPLREIQELVDEISPPVSTPAAATPKPAAAAPKAPAADPFAPAAGGGGGGLFGAPAAAEPSGGGLFATPAATAKPAKPASQSGGRAGGGVDLFAAAQATAVPSAPAPEEDDVVSSTGGGGGGLGVAAAGGGAGMTGQRNENSVLFSLSNLQALAGGGQKPAAPATTGAIKQASSEASGLIDIRALATTGPIGGSSSSGGVDDILSLGGASAFAPTLGAPVLLPAQQQSGSKALYVLIALAAVLVLGIIGLIVFIMMGKPDDTVAAGPGLTASPEVGGTTALGGVGSTMPSMTTGPASAGPATAAEEESDDPRRPGRVRRPGQPGPAGQQAAPVTAAPAGQTQTKKGGDDLDALLAGALGGGGAKTQKAAPAPAAGSGLPAQPSRGDIQSGMSGVAGAVRACGGGVSGTATIRVTISSSGRVTNASVTGPPFAGTPAGSCMARAARGATFPRFSNPSLTVNYPFVVR